MRTVWVWEFFAALGLDKLRVLCYTGKGCYKNDHLSHKNQHSHQLT